MSDADYLRETAALIRETAQAATPGPWGFAGTDNFGIAVHRGEHDTIALYAARDDARYIASWSPPVALAVADWLEDAAENLEMQAPGGELQRVWDMRVHIAGDKALAVARAWRGDA